MTYACSSLWQMFLGAIFICPNIQVNRFTIFMSFLYSSISEFPVIQHVTQFCLHLCQYLLALKSQLSWSVYIHMGFEGGVGGWDTHCLASLYILTPELRHPGLKHVYFRNKPRKGRGKNNFASHVYEGSSSDIWNPLCMYKCIIWDHFHGWHNNWCELSQHHEKLDTEVWCCYTHRMWKSISKINIRMYIKLGF